MIESQLLMIIPELRKYHISISAHKNAPQIADNILRSFDCIISEPSSWLLKGMTDEKGLTFVDGRGELLHSSIFKHQAYFHSDDRQTEKSAIELLIYTTLFDHYTFERKDLRIVVKRYE
jgi:hypothetical protein